MKIIYGITKSNFGGAQRYVFDLATEAKKRGHEVAVICGGNGILIDRLESSGVRVIKMPEMEREISLIQEFRSLKFLTYVLLNERPDVFHTNSSKMGGLGNVAGRLAGVKKIIFTGHGWEFNSPRPWWQRVVIKFFVWLTILFAHQTICVSEKTKRDVSWFLLKRKLTVVYNGIAPFELKPRTGKEFTIGTLAELHRVKGLDILLRAWSQFNHKHPSQLVIYGRGEEEGNLKALAQELGIGGRVQFKGFVENAKSHLSEFDIFVLPSRSEALPYVLLEAGLAGLGVIATRVGGIPEIIEEGKSGALVTPGNVKELATSLFLLAEDPLLRVKMGGELRERITRHFSLDQMVDKTLKAYSR